MMSHRERLGKTVLFLVWLFAICHGALQATPQFYQGHLRLSREPVSEREATRNQAIGRVARRHADASSKSLPSVPPKSLFRPSAAEIAGVLEKQPGMESLSEALKLRARMQKPHWFLNEFIAKCYWSMGDPDNAVPASKNVIRAGHSPMLSRYLGLEALTRGDPLTAVGFLAKAELPFSEKVWIWFRLFPFRLRQIQGRLFLGMIFLGVLWVGWRHVAWRYEGGEGGPRLVLNIPLPRLAQIRERLLTVRRNMLAWFPEKSRVLPMCALSVPVGIESAPVAGKIDRLGGSAADVKTEPGSEKPLAEPSCRSRPKISQFPLVPEVAWVESSEAARFSRDVREWFEARQERVLGLTSAENFDRRTESGIVFGLLLARMKLRVLLIEADPAQPRLATLLGGEGSPGLADLVDFSGNPRLLCRKHEEPHFSFIPWGAGENAERTRLSDADWAATFEYSRRKFDITLVVLPSLERHVRFQAAVRQGARILVLEHSRADMDAEKQESGSDDGFWENALGYVAINDEGALGEKT